MMVSYENFVDFLILLFFSLLSRELDSNILCLNINSEPVVQEGGNSTAHNFIIKTIYMMRSQCKTLGGMILMDIFCYLIREQNSQ